MNKLSPSPTLTLESAVTGVALVQALYNCPDIEAITRMQTAAAKAGDEKSLEILCEIKNELLKNERPLIEYQLTDHSVDWAEEMHSAGLIVICDGDNKTASACM